MFRPWEDDKQINENEEKNFNFLDCDMGDNVLYENSDVCDTKNHKNYEEMEICNNYETMNSCNVNENNKLFQFKETSKLLLI